MSELVPFLAYEDALLVTGRYGEILSEADQLLVELLLSEIENYIVGYIGTDPRLEPDIDFRMLSTAAIRLFVAWYGAYSNNTIGIDEQSFDQVKVKFTPDFVTDKLAHQILNRYALCIA